MTSPVRHLIPSPASPPRRRDLWELAVAYSLILSVEWTPRPWQRWLWLLAAAFIAAITIRSRQTLRSMGLRLTGLYRSLWIAAAAFVAAAFAVWFAARLGTLHRPRTLHDFVFTYAGYILWSFVQQFLLQIVFLSRLLRLLPGPRSAASAAALIFAAAHLPNPILAPATFLFGLVTCLVFLRHRNLIPVALAHAVLGVTIATTIPGPVLHNMRVGLGYLRYHPPAARTPPSPQP